MQPLWKAPLYYQAELARYVDFNAIRIYRWVRGDHSWLPTVSGPTGYTFGHMVELAIIHEMTEMGIPVARIRSAYEELRHQAGEFPFARNKMRELAGLAVWEEQMQELGAGGQLVFGEMTLEVGRHIKWSGEMPVEYRPLPEVAVLLAPDRSCGEPIIEKGIPTGTLYRAWKAEGGDTNQVAWDYGLQPSDIEAAVRFEEYFRPKQAA